MLGYGDEIDRELNGMDLIYVYEDPKNPQIRGKLSQGSARDVLNIADYPFVDCIVLAAADFQDPGPIDCKVIRAPFRDTLVPDPAEYTKIIETATGAAQRVAVLVKSGKHVLVTCQAGLNRSGLISAFALMDLGFSGDDAIEIVRKGRSRNALCNPTFVEIIKAVESERGNDGTTDSKVQPTEG